MLYTLDIVRPFKLRTLATSSYAFAPPGKIPDRFLPYAIDIIIKPKAFTAISLGNSLSIY